MSLILDALNRSRQDSTPVPGLETEPYMERTQSQWQKYLPWSGLMVALMVIVLLLLERGEPEPSAVLQAVTPTAPAPAAAPAPAPAPAPTAPAASALELNPPTVPAASLEVQAPTPPVEPARIPEPVDPAVAELYRQKTAEPRAESQIAASKPEVQELEPQVVAEPETAAPVDEEQAVDIEKLVMQAQDEMENARLEEHPAPFVADLSQQAKNDIPTVYYQRHEYSGNPRESVVFLNGKSLKVGDSPVAGMKVREILPDSVVLDYRGTEFRLRALNSWVNL